MSLIINDKKVAGLYKAYVIQNATNTASGIIRIATEEEVKAGLDSLTAVTPKQLATKQNVLIAGNGLEILEDGTINNTQTSAEWGNIIGNILDQEDLNTILLTKANTEETAYELVYENSILTLKNRKGDTLSEVSINELPDVDDATIVINEENKLQSIGEKTKSGTFKYTWIGTEAEYTEAKDLGTIDEFTECIIIDSEAEKVVPIVQYEAPTKLSELANDIEFVTNDKLQSIKTSLENKIDLQTDGAEIVHKVGNETIDGFKNFKQKIVIENGLNKGRIAHKRIDTSLEDGYIEFGDNTLLYGKQNINGELYDEKYDIFHVGNLVAGNNITITKKNGVYSINGKAGGGTGGGSIDNVDNETIIIQDDGSISAQGVLDQNTDELTAIKFWSGTLEEYNELGVWDDNTLYNITDDSAIGGELPIASTNTLGGVKVDGKTIKVTDEGVISANGGGLEIGDIGIAPLGIDETKGKRRYLNGQVIIQDQYIQFTQKLKKAIELYPSLACTESEWQTTATMTVGSQVGKFVVDDEAGTIRLPKIIMPIQGLTDLSKLGEIVEAGLPTHTHTRGTMNITGYVAGNNLTLEEGGESGGALYFGGGSYIGPSNQGVYYGPSINFDASRNWTGSTSTGNYSKALTTTDTVQQEQIQYPYFIQVATGAETEDNIVNEIELNNPYSLGGSKYSPKPLNNLSWLKSEGQWNSKAVYPSCYDWALTNANNGVEGFVTTNMYYFKCTTEDLVYCLTTATAKIGQAIYGLNTGFKGCVEEVTSNGFKFTDKEKGFIEFITDTNSYTHNPTGYEFVINTADETFKLPLLDGSEVLPSDRQEVISFNTDATYYVSKPVNGFYTLICRIANQGTGVAITNKATQQSARSNASFGNTMCAVTLFVPANNQVGLWKSALATTNPVNECYFIPAQGNGSLYYYVGETVQNANLINAGRIEEKVASLGGEIASLIPDNKSLIGSYAMPSNKVVNLTLGASGSTYTAPANGWMQCACTGTAGSTYFEIVTEYASATASFTGGWGRASIPVRKGAVVSVFYGGNNFTKQIFRFTYAEGEV